MALDIDTVYRDNKVKGDIHSGEHFPDKAEIRTVLKGLFGASANPSIIKKTAAALAPIIPGSENYGGLVLDDPDTTKNGYWYRSAGAWVFGRGFPDTLAKVTLSGSGTAQTGVVNAGVNPASIEVFFAKVVTENTGAMTLSISGGAAKPVVNLAGNPLSAGEWTGMVMFYLNDADRYQLLLDAGAAAAAAQSAADAAASESAAAASEAAAAQSAADAEAAAASVNLPVIQPGDAGKALVVREDEAGYELSDIADITSAETRAWAIANLHPASAPPFIRTAGYAMPGDGGGALYKQVVSEPSHAGKFPITLVGGMIVVWYEIAEEAPNILMFGATQADLYTGAQAAMEYLAASGGGTMRFPRGDYALATSLVCTASDVTILLDDDCTINHNTPDYMALQLQGVRNVVRGGINGGFVGPAAWDPASGAVTPTYAVIKFTGEFGRVERTRIINIRRVGIQFKDVNNGTVTGCFINGNLPAPTEPVTLTVHFGVHFDNGAEASNGNYKLTNNTMLGCMTGCAIASYGTGGLAMGSVVSGNVFQGMWDHAIYSNYTDGLTVTANAFNDCHLAIAMSGPRNIITANSFVTPSPGATTLLDAQGVSLRDPEYCVVSGNTFIGTAIAGSPICIDLGCFTKAIGNNVVADNTIRQVGAGTAIRITYRGQPYSVYNNRVSGNIVYAPGSDGDGVIRIDGNPSGGNTANVIANNTVTVTGEGASGIYLAYAGTSIVNDNLVSFEANAASAKTVASIVLFACNNIKTADNFTRVPAGFGTNTAVKGVNEIGGVSVRNEMRYNRAAISSVAAGFTYSEIAPSGGANPPLAYYEGSGVPGLIAANGSQYTRLDGGAGSTFYVREAGAWVAK